MEDHKSAGTRISVGLPVKFNIAGWQCGSPALCPSAPGTIYIAMYMTIYRSKLDFYPLSLH